MPKHYIGKVQTKKTTTKWPLRKYESIPPRHSTEIGTISTSSYSHAAPTSISIPRSSIRTKRRFFLSSTEGTAEAWKEVYMDEKSGSYGTFTDFIDIIKKAFSTADAEGEARAQLRHLRQEHTADEYIAQFRILAGRAKLTDDKTLTEYFIEGLNGGILQKIFALNPLPVTINDWYTYAARFDLQHRRLQEILKRKNGNKRFQMQTKKTNTPRFSGSY